MIAPHFQVPRRGWWITGGLNENEPNGILTTDFYNIGEEFGTVQHSLNAFIMGPTLPEGVSHHCLIKQANQAAASVKYLLIGGMTKDEEFSSKVNVIRIEHLYLLF